MSRHRSTKTPARRRKRRKQTGKPRSRAPSGVNYGVLKGTVVRGKREPDKNKPHYTIFLNGKGGTKKSYQAVVNVRSSVGNKKASEVLFFVDTNLLGQAPDRAKLAALWRKKLASLRKLSKGFTSLPAHKPGLALDYVREEYVHPNEMTHRPADGPRANDDVQDQLDFWVKKATDQNADIYVFGSGFPGGTHDVHMNQGNGGSFRKDNGVYQDGGIVLDFSSGTSVAIFVAFQSQSWDTDKSGNPY